MTRHDVYQNRPATGLGEQWRDTTPLGNGLTGVSLYGGCATERLVIGRYDLWHNARLCDTPDVSYALEEARQMMARGEHEAAGSYMTKELGRHGFSPRAGDLRTLAQITLALDCPAIYNQYTRTLHMDTGEAAITYRLGDVPYRRRTFVSRRRDITVSRMESGVAGGMKIIPGFFESGEWQAADMRKRDEAEACWRLLSDGIVYSTKNDDGKYFGLVARVVTDGQVTTLLSGEAKTDPKTPHIVVENATDTTLLVAAFSGERSRALGEHRAQERLNKAAAETYDTLLAEHVRLHRRLYNAADLRLYNGRTFHSNEELLADARQNACSAELAEKLWRFGRYLFISGTHKKGSPFPLYGLWVCGYYRPWNQHVGNENVEIIHWHAAVGGLQSLIPTLIHYYYRQMDTAREAARKIYGCRGIFFSVYSTPICAQISPMVPVILHFVGTAGWLCRHFYEYYLLSQDESLLEKEILPLMLETAAFYEDYVTEEQGNLTIYPGVSPENSPYEFINTDNPTATGHYMPVTKDATIEFAILKELLTNLLTLSKTHRLPAERVARWQDMLAKIPDYRINADGAIAEWIEPAWSDNYFHRHISHVYPIFPGTEIMDAGRKELIPAFRKAVELRQLGAMTGWSMAHMAAIYARLEDATKAAECIDMVTKVCLLENFLTMHNDYRGMGVTVDPARMGGGDPNFAPVQLDALMGCVNAAQEMLLFVSPTRVHLLPACPARWNSGKTTLHIFGGTVTLEWNLEKRCGRAVFRADRDLAVTVRLPFGKGEKVVALTKGDSETIDF